jgi:sigma-B regulation protein RsbU (phosphoserine phosphatase)
MPSPHSSVVDPGGKDRPGPDPAFDAFAAALLADDVEQLYERAPCGYLSTTPDGGIVKVNETFLALTGYRRDDLVGKRTFASLLTGGGRIYHETHYAPMLRMQSSARGIALDLVAADGRRLPVLVNSVLARDGAGEPVVVRTAVFDATERREYERELLRAKQRAEASEVRARHLASTLQQTLIPPAPPNVPGLDVAAAYRPAGSGDEVGGDFYDVFEVATDDWVLAVGDVRGKGVDAAVVTSLARHTLRGAAVRFPQPSGVLAALNKALLGQDDPRFATVVLVRLRRLDGRWQATLACGGHPLPLFVRRGEEPREVGAPGTLLGVLDEPEFVDTEISLAPGDALFCYTDGVTEGRREREFYGESRLVEALARGARTASGLVDDVLASVLAFQSGDARDDIALVAVRVPPLPSAGEGTDEGDERQDDQHGGGELLDPA